jgi:hypothetical protein
MDGEPDCYQGLERAAESGEVDLGVETADDAPLAKRAQPGQRGRGRDPDRLGEALVCDPGVRGHELEDRAVYGVDGRLWMIRHQSNTAGPLRILFDKME